MPKGAWNQYEDDKEKMRPGDGVIVSFLTKQYIMRPRDLSLSLKNSE